MKRRKEVYEALHPETRHVSVRGGPGRGHKTNEIISPVFSFSSDTAAKTGLTPRSIQQSVQIAEKIATWEIRILNGPRVVYRGTDEREARMYYDSYVTNGEFLPGVTLMRDGVVVAEWRHERRLSVFLR